MTVQAPHPSIRPHLPALAAALSAALLASCGDPEPDAHLATVDLLARTPSVVFESAGELLPTDPGVFNAYEGEGWSYWIGVGPEDLLVGLMVEPEAALYFTPSAPKDRTLELFGYLPWNGPDTAPVEVHLNGVDLGDLMPTKEPATYELFAPKDAWLDGRNRVSFHMDVADMPVKAEDGMAHGLHLASLRYEEPLLVEREAPGPHEPQAALRVPATAGLAYHLEQRGVGFVDVSVRAESAGELRLDTQLLDPTTSAPLTDTLDSRTVPLAAGATWRERVPVPRRFDGVCELALRWDSPEHGDLLVTELTQTEESAGPPPPIVLISIDTLGARHLSLYGYPLETSPHIDAWAAGTPGPGPAVVFDAARANAPWTMPSFAALMTGYYPSSARIKPNLTSEHFASTLPQNRWTLAESLRAAGYHTGAFVDSPNVGGVLGFDQGFDVFDESATDVPHGEPGGALATSSKAALAWLDALPEDAPYFLFLHANDVHGPYVPGDADLGHFQASLTDVGRELTTGGRTDVFFQIPKYLDASALVEFDPRASRLPADPLRAAYDETIRSMDRELGSVLAALDARGVLDEAIVILTADHGEAFDQHDKLGHSLVYDEVLRVPLVISLPTALREQSLGAPQRVSANVQLVDLFPTLFELVGLRTERRDWHGRSLVPALHGEPLESVPSYAEGGIMPQAALISGDWKLVERRPTQAPPWTMVSDPAIPAEWRDTHLPGLLDAPLDRERLFEVGARSPRPYQLYAELRELLDDPVLELYDLRADPLELQNLADAEPERLAELQTLMEDSRALLDAALEQESAAQVELSPEHRANLEVLGY